MNLKRERNCRHYLYLLLGWIKALCHYLGCRTLLDHINHSLLNDLLYWKKAKPEETNMIIVMNCAVLDLHIQMMTHK